MTPLEGAAAGASGEETSSSAPPQPTSEATQINEPRDRMREVRTIQGLLQGVPSARVVGVLSARVAGSCVG